MKKILVIYSPLCEANGAFIGLIHEWLKDKNIEIELCPYDIATKKHKELLVSNENCFINVFYEGKRIDFVPLHRERLLLALGIETNDFKVNEQLEEPTEEQFSEDEIRNQILRGNIKFIPITKKNYHEEMSMCLINYPRGNPPERYHKNCFEIKQAIFSEVFNVENIAGIYAIMNEKVIGLLEVFPREIVKKYGYMTGIEGDDIDTLTVACYEIGYGIPRILMIDELMHHLMLVKECFNRKVLEGIGIFKWNDGFNPYWVFEKYGFILTEKKSERVVVMTRTIKD